MRDAVSRVPRISIPAPAYCNGATLYRDYAVIAQHEDNHAA
jgi:hypothetical protein